jgi:hypothetical protein
MSKLPNKFAVPRDLRPDEPSCDGATGIDAGCFAHAVGVHVGNAP